MIFQKIERMTVQASCHTCCLDGENSNAHFCLLQNLKHKHERLNGHRCRWRLTSGLLSVAGLFPAIMRKGPWPKLGKMIDLTSKLGEINDI